MKQIPCGAESRRRLEKIEFYNDFAIFEVDFYVLPENFFGSSAIFSAGRGSPSD